MGDTVLPRRTKFGEQLRQELDRQRLSIRKFARQLDSDRPERAKRNLARWIGGYNEPSRIHRIEVAEALGLPAETFLADDDEEEDPLVALMNVVRRLVREELESVAQETA